MENKKIFSKYIMSFEEDNITSLLDSNGKDTLFAYTFYNANKEYLDEFENILTWVKPKKETIKKNNIIISLDDYSISYSNNNDKVSEEDLKQAMRIVKNEMSEANPEIAKQKALLIKYTNDIKTLESLQEEGMTFEEEIEEIQNKQELARKKIDELLSIE